MIFFLLIARFIVIDIAPLTVLFCSCPLFCNWPPLICNCPLLKDVSSNKKCLFDVLTSDHMLSSGDFWYKSLSQFLKIIPNRPPKHVITSTNVNKKAEKILTKFLSGDFM